MSPGDLIVWAYVICQHVSPVHGYQKLRSSPLLHVVSGTRDMRKSADHLQRSSEQLMRIRTMCPERGEGS